MLRKLVNSAGTFLKSTKISKVVSGNNAFVKMAESLEAMALKRPAMDSEDPEAKKLKTDDTKIAEVTTAHAKTEEASNKSGENGNEGQVTLRKKKVALFMMYSGVGYYGMQFQPRDSGLKSIEGELLKALVSVGAIPEEHAAHTNKMSFQRAARTDKGVSAAGNCVSLKLLYNIPNLKEKINTALPDQMKVIDIFRTTATFDSKNYCDSRTYSYMLPTFAFAPIENVVYQSFRAPEGTIKRVNEILGIYKGTHNFHNFTSGKKPHEMSANRFIIDMKCGEPFIQDDIEFAVIKVKGQSFMLHQIRKMIGLMIAVVRGLASVDCIQKSFGPFKTDVPKAPGLGLMLEKLHYDTYNRRFGNDGVHVPLSFEDYEDDITEFKKKYIYSTMVKTEKEENSMMNWLSTLFSHNYDYRVNMDVPPRAEIGTGQAEFKAERAKEEKDKNGEDAANVKQDDKMDSKISDNDKQDGKETDSKICENDLKFESDSKVCEMDPELKKTEPKCSDSESSNVNSELPKPVEAPSDGLAGEAGLKVVSEKS